MSVIYGSSGASLSSRKTLSNIRMATSTLGETYYITKNALDHTVAFGEKLLYGDKYLKERLKEYKGQKRIAFLYHGYFQARPAFERLERVMESELFNIFAFAGGYQPYCQDIRRSAEHEVGILEYVMKHTDAEHVYLIGHSQGGLVARTMLQLGDAAQYVEKCVTLSTPHQGTYAAVAGAAHLGLTKALSTLRLIPKIEGESGLQMIPGSALIRELNGTPLPATVDFFSIFAEIDGLVFPPRLATIPFPEAHNIMIKKIGHLQTLYNIQALEIILRSLLLHPGKSQHAKTSEVLVGYDVVERKRMSRAGRKYTEYVAGGD